MNYISAKLAVGHNTVQEMIQSLGYRKVCAHWVPCLLTETTNFREEPFGWETLPHPSYNPDLAPSDYHLFSSVKEQMQGQCYETLEEIRQAVRQCLWALERSSITRIFSNFQNDGKMSAKKKKNGDYDEE